MKAELRIGNHIGQGEVMEIKENVVRVKYTADKERTSLIRHEDVQPIPLSEEVLLKCGFKLNKEKTLFEHDKCGLRLTDIVGLYYRGNFPIKADVTSIHQLQNLYYKYYR